MRVHRLTVVVRRRVVVRMRVDERSAQHSGLNGERERDGQCFLHGA